MDEQTWKGMLDDCDTNKDGQVIFNLIHLIYCNNLKISQSEFIDLLLKKFI